MKHDFQKQPRSARAVAGQPRPDSAAKIAEARKKYERQIEAVARKVNLYRIDTQRFLAGDLKLPPEELREEIQTELRKLQSSKLASSADRFRLGSLEGQFNSHIALYGRRLREREEGTDSRRRAERPELRHDPVQGVLFGRDGAVEALYKGLFLKQSRAKPSMDLERFRNHLEKQAAAIRTKTGCQDIQFRIAEENGKMKIKAKPIKKKAGP